MSYQQLIAGKVKLNGLEGIRRHLQERERVKNNPNIDLSLLPFDQCEIANTFVPIMGTFMLLFSLSHIYLNSFLLCVTMEKILEGDSITQ